MTRHPKKRQRLDVPASPKPTKQLSSKKAQKQAKKPLPQPLGSSATLERLLDEESKDDEERRLESMLFGVPYVPKGKAPSSKQIKTAEGGLVFEIDEEDEEGEGEDGGDGEDGGRPMANLLDSDVRLDPFVENQMLITP